MCENSNFRDAHNSHGTQVRSIRVPKALSYMSMKKLPSERHLTSVVGDNLPRNLLHRKNVAKPPAEPPDNIAFTPT